MGTKQIYFLLPTETVLHHFKWEQGHTAAVDGNGLLSYLCSTLIAPLVLLLLSLSQSPNLYRHTEQQQFPLRNSSQHETGQGSPGGRKITGKILNCNSKNDSNI